MRKSTSSKRVKRKSYGAAGVGCTSRFGIEIDEALDDSNDLQMSINSREWSFRFSLSGRESATRIFSFLKEQTGLLVFSELLIGSFLGAPVRLIKDKEFADRFWIRASRADQMIEFVLAADTLKEFTDAIAQAVQDLQS